MGNLVGSWRFKEPSTVEECDSTWGSDSESDEPTAEDDSGISDSVSPAESERAAGHSGDAALRITRILKSLGELGYEAFKAPLVRLFLEESLCSGMLPNMQHSVLEYFVYTIRLPATRRRLLRFARKHYRPAHAFLWGPPSKKGACSGGGGGGGSSGIRAPAPTPEHHRRGEENTASSRINVSSHAAIMCQDLVGGGMKGFPDLGSYEAGLPGELMLVSGRRERSEFS